jgi:hypothetical protein
MNLIRSRLEALCHDALEAAGGVGFSPLRAKDAKVLQAEFGARWKGDLTAYRYVSDIIAFPSPGMPINVFELFALRRVKRYDIGKAAKEIHGRELEEAEIIKFLALDARRLNAEQVQKGASDLFMGQPGIWRGSTPSIHS